MVHNMRICAGVQDTCFLDSRRVFQVAPAAYHFISQLLLSTCYGLDTVLGAGGMRMNKMNRIPALAEPCMCLPRNLV